MRGVLSRPTYRATRATAAQRTRTRPGPRQVPQAEQPRPGPWEGRSAARGCPAGLRLRAQQRRQGVGGQTAGGGWAALPRLRLPPVRRPPQTPRVPQDQRLSVQRLSAEPPGRWSAASSGGQGAAPGCAAGAEAAAVPMPARRGRSETATAATAPRPRAHRSEATAAQPRGGPLGTAAARPPDHRPEATTAQPPDGRAQTAAGRPSGGPAAVTAEAQAKGARRQADWGPGRYGAGRWRCAGLRRPPASVAHSCSRPRRSPAGHRYLRPRRTPAGRCCSRSRRTSGARCCRCPAPVVRSPRRTSRPPSPAGNPRAGCPGDRPRDRCRPRPTTNRPRHPGCPSLSPR